MTDTFLKALQKVRQQIASKTQQRNQIDAEIAQLRATEIGLQNALGQQEQAEIAWTNLVRTVIFNYAGQQPMSAVQVRDTLQSWGYTFDGISNPLAFFNNILERLWKQGEIQRTDVGRPFKFSCNE
jgi:hypothetical protein